MSQSDKPVRSGRTFTVWRVTAAAAVVVAGALTFRHMQDQPLVPVVSILVAPPTSGVILHRQSGVGWGVVDGKLYAGSAMVETLYRIDPKTGVVDVAVGPPFGEADDVAMASDGTLYWTAITTGELRYKHPDGAPQVLDPNVPGINPVAVRSDGRVVAAQANLGHALYEYDPAGAKPRRLIMQDMPDLNSFGFGSDGLLYSPQKPDKMVSVNIDTGELKVLGAEGFGGGVKVDSHGQVISIASESGRITRTDPQTGKTDLIGTLPSPIDTLALGADDTIYASSPADGTIYAVDPNTGAVRDLVRGRFSALGGLAITQQDGKELLLAADAWGYRNINPTTGDVVRPPTRSLRSGASSDIAVNATAIALANVRLGVVQKADRATEKVIFETKEIKHPYGVAILDDGALAVADFDGNRIARVDANGITTLAGDLKGPVGLIRDSSGNLLVSEALGGTVSHIDVKGGARTEIVTDLQKPESLGMMADGRLAIVEAGAKRVIAVDLKKKERQTLADNLPIGVHISLAPKEIGLPVGLAVGGDGAIYVGADGDYSIRKITFAKADQAAK